MKQHEIEKLKKQYPESKYNIRESQGSLIVSPKKTSIRIFRDQAEKSFEKSNPTKKITALLGKTQITKKDFEQKQVTITKELNEKILRKVADCKTRRVIFLQKLLGEDA